MQDEQSLFPCPTDKNTCTLLLNINITVGGAPVHDAVPQLSLLSRRYSRIPRKGTPNIVSRGDLTTPLISATK